MNPVEEFARRYFRDDQVVWRTDQHKAFDGPPCPKDPRHNLLAVQFGSEIRVSCNGKFPPAEIEAALANTVASLFGPSTRAREERRRETSGCPLVPGAKRLHLQALSGPSTPVPAIDRL